MLGLRQSWLCLSVIQGLLKVSRIFGDYTLVKQREPRNVKKAYLRTLQFCRCCLSAGKSLLLALALFYYIVYYCLSSTQKQRNIMTTLTNYKVNRFLSPHLYRPQRHIYWRGCGAVRLVYFITIFVILLVLQWGLCMCVLQQVLFDVAHAAGRCFPVCFHGSAFERMNENRRSRREWQNWQHHKRRALQWKCSIPSTLHLFDFNSQYCCILEMFRAWGRLPAGFLCRTLITVKPRPKANKDFFNYLGSHFNTQNSMTS